MERRKQLHNQANNNQIHFTRTNELEDSLVIEKKPPTPNEILQSRPSGKEIKRDCILLYIFFFD